MNTNVYDKYKQLQNSKRVVMDVVILLSWGTFNIKNWL